MENFTTRSENEAKTIKAMFEFRNAATSSAEIMVANVFEKMWSSAMTEQNVVSIGEAIHNCEGLDVKSILAKMVRAKILRTRTITGRRFYEVNF